MNIREPTNTGAGIASYLAQGFVAQPGERLGMQGKGRVQALFFLGKLGMFRWRCALNKKVESSMSMKNTPFPTWRSPPDKLTAVVVLPIPSFWLLSWPLHIMFQWR